MQRRLIAAIAAVVLAGIGAILLFNYVSNADTRAMAGQEPTEVLVVTTQVPSGTLGSQMGGFVTKRLLPKSAIAPGALTNLDTVQDLATTIELEVGEQVMAARFAAPGTSASGEVQVPNDMQQISIQLEPQRVVGGTLKPGDKVAVYATMDEVTQQILTEALVSQVAGEEGSASIITLALPPRDTERVVLATEEGKVWLAKAAKISARTVPITKKQVLR